MDTVVSGIRPTGNLHLGNYFGAVRNFIKMQQDYNSFFFVADYHSLTTHPNPADLNTSVRQVLAEYLACGIDPEKCTLYIQSDVPETAELYLLLNMLAYVGELERSTSFKDKIRMHPDNVNAGLLTYPVLMAADIIIHRAHKVPVGKDQQQHLEMTRNFVNRFNHLYGVNYFPEPEAFNFSEELIKVPGLDGSGKMGKSAAEGNTIFLVDEPEAIRKKVMRAVTDTGPVEPNQPKSESIANIFTLMKLVSDSDTVEHFESSYNNCTIRYGDMKKQLAEDMIRFIAPIQQQIKKFFADTELLHTIVSHGAEKAKESAAITVNEVRKIIGIKKF
ncbi:MAG: tryptophan--tRNA ligase [Chitinophagales bacterium]|nr:tryptophan--tRNA ligase [Chitinophagales bacterium]